MTANDHEEDAWSSLVGRQDVQDEDALPHFGLPRPENAALVGLAFVAALLDERSEAPEHLVTPESRKHWGDFSAARELLAAIPNRGIGSRANRAFDARDVAYVKILAEVTRAFVIKGEEQVVEVAAVVSLVWRPELGSWLVHAVGDPVHPLEMPRTSPGSAPSDHID